MSTFDMSAGLNRQVPGVQFLLASLPPLGSEQVAAMLCPSCWWVQVTLVCPFLTLKPCVDQQPVGSQFGLTADQCDRQQLFIVLIDRVDGGFGGFGRQSRAMAALASARAFASFLLAVTSFSVVLFFWMAALARLSSDLAIMVACSVSVAA